jgi:Zn-dependent M28 family amino/carboxypeptidase
MKEKLILAVAALFAAASCARAPDPAAADPAAAEPEPHPLALELPEGAERAAEVIDAATLETVVRALSDDAMEGRGPASAGDARVRQYLIDAMKGLGLAPGMPDGGWEQPIEMVGVTAHLPESWIFHRDGAGGELVDLAWWTDYIASSGVQKDEVAIEDAEVVFVGYGIEAPEEGWDDFKGVDVAGKILLMMNSDPDWDPALFAGQRRLYYGRWTYKYESAARHGAAGAILIHTTPSAGYPFQVVQTSWTGEQFELPAGDEPRIRIAAWATEDAARRLAALGGHDLDALYQAARNREFRPMPLGVSTSIRFTNTLRPGSHTANLLGLIPGRDPELQDELVVYTAHHDHLGVGEPDTTGDRIYNGARDNASGVATVLAAAKAFRAMPQPPRRSVLFLIVAAEEQGLLGSQYYANHPTVHPGRIAANLNFDSSAIFGATRDVPVIGRGKSGLEELLEIAAARQGRRVVDEPFPDKGYYYRSDQFNFAKIGVPALYFTAGTDFPGRPPEWGRKMEDDWRATRYHQPSDEIYDAWSFDGMVQDARLAFWVGLAVSEMDDPPGWRPGDEFEAMRERMLAEAASR